MLHQLDRLLPRRLTTRITLALVVIVVMAGLITTGAINWLVGHNLRDELIASGEALTLALGENLANALIESDLATVQESLDSVVGNNDDVVYAFAFGLDSSIVHTFSNGFPTDLLRTIPATAETPGEGTLLRTEQGLVRDFGYRPLDGLPAEVHLGISQARIGRVQAQVTSFVFMLTVAGCLVAAMVAYGFSRMVTFPLVELTRRVKRLGSGHLDERIELPPGDEVGDLAAAFNHMAADIQTAIHQLQISEGGYRDLLTAAGTVGEGIALICDEGRQEGTFLFVNDAFAHLAGFQPADLVGVNAASILHPDSLATARRNWAAIRTKNSRSPYELTLVDRHIQPHILETTGTIIEYQGKRALVWFTRDISERKAREDELRRRNRELTALNAVASAVSGSFAADQILNRALRQTLTALDLQIGWIFVRIDEDNVRLAACQGLPADATSFDFPNCQCGRVLSDGQPEVVIPAGNACVTSQATSPQASLTCHATVPLQAREEILGVLSVAAGSPKAFDKTEIDLLAAVGRQVGIALQNARLWDEVRQREQVRGELLRRVISAQEEERRRIARELHDGIGQSLNALVFGLNTVDASLQQGSDQVPDQMARLKISASDTVKELQDIIYDLRPSLLDDLGLMMALRWYAQERLEVYGVQIKFDVPQQGLRLPLEIETALFRVGQEAITNIGKHAQAQQVTISLQTEPEKVRLEIDDNGVGFELNHTLTGQGDRPAWGLLGMQERVSLLGGELSIQSEPGQGTQLCVTLPLGDDDV
jgi:PAS domain S-box-containing protein